MRRFVSLALVGIVAFIGLAGAAAAKDTRRTLDRAGREACADVGAIAVVEVDFKKGKIEDGYKRSLNDDIVLLGRSRTKGSDATAKLLRKAVTAKDAKTANRLVGRAGKWCDRNAPATTTTTTVPPTTVPQLDPAQAEAIYKLGATTPPYDELAKNPDGTGAPVHYRAKIFQFDTRTGPTAMLVYVTLGEFDFWEDNVLVVLESAEQGSGIDQDDIVEFWGDPAGAYSYDTAIGGSNTVPQIDARYISLISKG